MDNEHQRIILFMLYRNQKAPSFSAGYVTTLSLSSQLDVRIMIN